MKLKFYIKNKIDITEHSNIIKFLDSLNFYCIEQHPGWNNNKGLYYFCVDENQKLLCSANIFTSKGLFKIASINFGPAFANFEVLTVSINFLYNYFLSQGFIHFSIQLGTHICYETELLEYTLNRNLKVKYFFKPGNLWSSLCVDLTKSEAEILKSFSKGHKSAIKSASAKNILTTSTINDHNHLNSFIELYIKMYANRNMHFDKKEIANSFYEISKFINEYNSGFIEYVLEGDVVVGGLVIIFQGNSARYYKSASDPDKRELSIMHVGLFDAMRYCKTKGLISFDLWGYNHLVDDKDQVFYINRFKKGFSENFTFFPKRMNFELKPLKYKLYKTLKFVKKGILGLSLVSKLAF